ncbi:MAG: hypothetical protein WAJ95_10050, partial [Desulfobacterales bacterium]
DSSSTQDGGDQPEAGSRGGQVQPGEDNVVCYKQPEYQAPKTELFISNITPYKVSGHLSPVPLFSSNRTNSQSI